MSMGLGDATQVLAGRERQGSAVSPFSDEEISALRSLAREHIGQREKRTQATRACEKAKEAILASGAEPSALLWDLGPAMVGVLRDCGAMASEAVFAGVYRLRNSQCRDHEAILLKVKTGDAQLIASTETVAVLRLSGGYVDLAWAKAQSA